MSLSKLYYKEQHVAEKEWVVDMESDRNSYFSLLHPVRTWTSYQRH